MQESKGGRSAQLKSQPQTDRLILWTVKVEHLEVFHDFFRFLYLVGAKELQLSEFDV